MAYDSDMTWEDDLGDSDRKALVRARDRRDVARGEYNKLWRRLKNKVDQARWRERQKGSAKRSPE